MYIEASGLQQRLCKAGKVAVHSTGNYLWPLVTNRVLTEPWLSKYTSSIPHMDKFMTEILTSR